MRLGAIEGGGTKFIAGIGDENGTIIERVSFPTTTPKETMQKCVGYFKDKNIEAIGFGCFGPIDPDKSSQTYGYVTTTPKPGWANYNVIGDLKKAFPQIPIGFDTDVNGACLGEVYFGSAKGLDSAVYFTIGTGIGGGAYVEGQLLHGLLHPEMGHMKLIVREDDHYKGKCPFHSTCFEGLAAGPAIEERWGISAKELDINHPAWDLEAYYIGQALANIVLVLSPKKIILGGGVMHQSHLFPMIQKYMNQFLEGYIQKKELADPNYIVWPKLGDNAGLCGSLALAKQVLMTK